MKKIIFFVLLLSLSFLLLSCNDLFCSHENMRSEKSKATCREHGIDLSYCVDCGYYDIKLSDTLDHSFSEEDHKCIYCSICDVEYCDHEYELSDYLNAVFVTPTKGRMSSGGDGSNLTLVVPNLSVQLKIGDYCDEGPVAVYSCHLCGDSYTESQEPQDHDMVLTGNKIEAYCLEDGWVEYSCTKCAFTEKKVIEAPDHIYNASHKCACGFLDPQYCTSHKYEFSRNTYEDCTLGGFSVFACRVCGDEVFDVLPPTKHEKIMVQLSTGRKSCTVCNKEIDTLAECGHDGATIEVLEPSTCVKAGRYRYRCEECNSIGESGLAPIGHDFSDDIHSCTECGIMDKNYCLHEDVQKSDLYFSFDIGLSLYECSKCDYSYYEQSPAKRHQYVLTFSDFKMCEKWGASFRCTECNIQTSIDDLRCHDYDESTHKCNLCGIIHPGYCDHKISEKHMSADCSSGIIKNSYCSICDTNVISEVTPPIEHTPERQEYESKKASCTERGRDVYCCGICGTQICTVETAPAGHKYDSDGNCTECD